MLSIQCILGDPQCRGTQSEVATSPLPSCGPKIGEKQYVHLHSRGSPTPNASSKIRSGPQQTGTKSEMAASPLALGTRKRAEMLCHPCILRDPQHRGTKSKLAASGPPSRVPKRGRKCYGFPAFSEIPNIGEQNQKWLPHTCLLGCPKEGANATASLHSQGYPT